MKTDETLYTPQQTVNYCNIFANLAKSKERFESLTPNHPSEVSLKAVRAKNLLNDIQKYETINKEIKTRIVLRGNLVIDTNKLKEECNRAINLAMLI